MPPKKKAPSLQQNWLSEDQQQAPPGGYLKRLANEMRKCTKCPLSEHRTLVVFGQGAISNPPVLFLGEAPGATEDQKGVPFVGRAGDLLTKIIESMHLTREQVYICNAVGCRPENNKTPEKQEVLHCNAFALGQIRSVQPKVIVTLGTTALWALLRIPQLAGNRGVWKKWEGIPVMPTYHPAFLLRSPQKKVEVWEDMQLVMQYLEKKK